LEEYSTPSTCLRNLEHLSGLTKLNIVGYKDVQDKDDADTALQQLLSLPLPLPLPLPQQLHLEDSLDSDSVEPSAQPALQLDMRRMTQLTQFTADVVLLEGSMLPQQLQQLELSQVHTGPQLAVVMRLKQLTALKIGVQTQQQQLLLRLAHLPALQQLRLEYQAAEAAAATAPTWVQLPPLREVCARLGHTTRQQMAAIVAGLAAATSLTGLTFQFKHTVGAGGLWAGWQLQVAAAAAAAAGAAAADGGADAAVEPLAVCASIAQLTELVCLDLNFNHTPMARRDALALTALMGLEHLGLSAANQGVDDVAATALAVKLTQLRHLDLTGCDLGYMACLAAVAQLTQLTTLRLGNNLGLTEEGLMLLTRLSRLQGQHVTGCQGVGKEMLERFGAAVQSRGG
jgi:hypothetical protein